MKHYRSLLKLAMPLSLMGLLQSGVYFFETMFLSELGSDILAAGALVSWLSGTLTVILLGILSSINVLVAHESGAQQYHLISRIVRDGAWLALLIVLPAFALFWFISPVFLLLGQPPAVVVLLEPYLHALAFGLLPNFLTIVLLELMLGLGHTRILLKLTIIEVTICIFFSYALIFGKFGMPALGISGAGWGMTISYWIIMMVIGVYVVSNHSYRRYLQDIFTFKKPRYLASLLRIGFPMGVMYCIEVAFFFALTLVMGLFGTQMLAANQIALQYAGILMSVIFSIAQAITVRMGHLLGAGDVASASKAAYAGVSISSGLMLIVAVVYWIFPKVLIAIDLDPGQLENTEIVRLATQLFMVSAVFQIFEATRIALFGALRSLQDTKFTLFISVLSFWCIALPGGYAMAVVFHWEGIGLWIGMVLGACVSVLLLYWRFKIKIANWRCA